MGGKKVWRSLFQSIAFLHWCFFISYVDFDLKQYCTKKFTREFYTQRHYIPAFLVMFFNDSILIHLAIYL